MLDHEEVTALIGVLLDDTELDTVLKYGILGKLIILKTLAKEVASNV